MTRRFEASRLLGRRGAHEALAVMVRTSSCRSGLSSSKHGADAARRRRKYQCRRCVTHGSPMQHRRVVVGQPTLSRARANLRPDGRKSPPVDDSRWWSRPRDAGARGGCILVEAAVMILAGVSTESAQGEGERVPVASAAAVTIGVHGRAG